MIMEKKLESASPDETESIAIELAKEAKAGSIYTLSGDLGAGKTVFARGFARGLGIMSPVTSPTFTLVNEYKKGRLPLYHFDVYRLGEAEELYDTGFEDYLENGGVVLIEWAERIEELLPRPYFYISIEKDLSRGEDFRLITLKEMQ
ncbi:MAG: tRNA (adenosine(37)-N6)-threonylcarbamoyltransferase complex ATPase subunit type 1 TsaE [Lachnospiraceae bacterium]|jgi:tRNA threonylcarbamoyladenosine biosynthesis protein TsaE|nr:tRNA (adenosine(37)-N6)-threonylcarbamoyltransferase complex ATPase subunit type 1 TsaE [Lachnospiraceae bacterium]MBQ6258554.1 tRNA (adenosine(37)-N6)-threonylcarbamoyltransferase complex ATPase subunit type 1 TsaE [Lachnospiraceae bacterium]